MCSCGRLCRHHGLVIHLLSASVDSSWAQQTGGLAGSWVMQKCPLCVSVSCQEVIQLPEFSFSGLLIIQVQQVQQEWESLSNQAFSKMLLASCLLWLHQPKLNAQPNPKECGRRSHKGQKQKGEHCAYICIVSGWTAMGTHVYETPCFMSNNRKQFVTVKIWLILEVIFIAIQQFHLFIRQLIIHPLAIECLLCAKQSIRC